MYHYLYDSFLTDPKFGKPLTQIENRLTDLGIYGNVHRLALFKTMKGTIQDAVRRGGKTIVAVGDDASVAKAIDAVAEFPNVTFGIIPMGGGSHSIAGLLGIPEGVAACDVLSARLVESLDLGKVNNHHFLTSLTIPGEVQAECDGRYTVSLENAGEICVSNLTGAGDRQLSDPRDGRLETLVRTAARGFFRSMFGPRLAPAAVSVFPTERVVIRAANRAQLTAVADGLPYNDAEFRVEIMPQRLKVIVGKGRNI